MLIFRYRRFAASSEGRKRDGKHSDQDGDGRRRHVRGNALLVERLGPVEELQGEVHGSVLAGWYGAEARRRDVGQINASKAKWRPPLHTS